MTALVPHAPPTGVPTPGSPIGSFLRDPTAAWRALAEHALGLLREHAITTIVAVVAALAVGLTARRWRRRLIEQQWHHGARWVAVQAPPEVDPAGATALWGNLIGLLRPAWRRVLFGQPHLAFELVWAADTVTIGFWVPGVVPPGLVERAVEAAWPGAHTSTPAKPPPPTPTPTDDATVVMTGGQLRLARTEALPLRTEHDTDPLRALLGATSGLDQYQTAVVQILARPVTGRRLARQHHAAHRLGTGRAPRPLSRMLDALTPGAARSTTRRTRTPDPHTTAHRQGELRAALAKTAHAQFEVAIRYAIATTLPSSDANRSKRRRAMARLRGRAHALASAFSLHSGRNSLRRHRLHHPARTLAQRRFDRGDLLSVPELATLAHLPTDPLIPGLDRAGARALAPPPTVPTRGAAIKPLGMTDAGHPRPVGLHVSDARHHLHVLGSTGAGKSSLLAHLVLDDAHARRGCVLIDPKGDLVTDVLHRLPARDAARMHLFDPDHPAWPPCLNPLDDPDPDTAVDNVVSIFRRVYAAFWGPRTDDLMRAACLTLCATSRAPTLADLPTLLAEPAFRARAVARLDDDLLAGFWAWYDTLGDGARAQLVGPLMNKLRAFLLRPFVRAALAGGPSTIDFARVLDGGLCLVRLPKGQLGEETTRLIGSLIVARTWQAATARAHQPQHDRRDASLVIDECHNFLNLPYPIQDILAEARGYRLGMVLAHQNLAQLPRELKEGIAANARSKVIFTASPEDARDLERHTIPQLRAHDLSHLAAFHAAARLVVNGSHTPAFTLATRPLPPARPRPKRTTDGRTPGDRTARYPAPGGRARGRGRTDPRRAA